MPDSQIPHLPVTHYARLSDVGRRRLANEDAANHDPRLCLFVVCDGVGGHPSGEAASHLIAHGLPHLFRQKLRDMIPVDYHLDTPSELLQQSFTDLAIALRQIGDQHTALKGMSATAVAALIDADRLHIVWAGDSRCYLLRDGKLHLMTVDDAIDSNDQAVQKAGLVKPAGAMPPRLLTQTVGGKTRFQPHAKRILLKPKDRLLLCTDGLTDPVPDAAIAKILIQQQHADQATQQLIDIANQAGGPDNITVNVIDFLGVRPVTDEDRKPPPAVPTRRCDEQADQARYMLNNLIQDLNWLTEIGDHLIQGDSAWATEQANKRLAEAWPDALPMEQGAALIDRFHSACCSNQSQWWNEYTHRMSQLEPLIEELTDLKARLSPKMWPEDTSRILARLWHSWRDVETRFMNACRQQPLKTAAPKRAYLAQHMLNSAKTLVDLIEALPHFLRTPPTPKSSSPTNRPSDSDDALPLPG